MWFNSHNDSHVPCLLFHQSDIAAVPCGRNFLSCSAHVLLNTLMKLLEQMKSGVFPKLKVYVELW